MCNKHEPYGEDKVRDVDEEDENEDKNEDEPVHEYDDMDRNQN